MIKVRYFLVRLFKETKTTSIRGRQLRRENETYLFYFFDFFFCKILLVETNTVTYFKFASIKSKLNF